MWCGVLCCVAPCCTVLYCVLLCCVALCHGQLCCKTEIGQLYLTFSIQHDIIRFDVPVDYVPVMQLYQGSDGLVKSVLAELLRVVAFHLCKHRCEGTVHQLKDDPEAILVEECLRALQCVRAGT